ncbi:MAG: phage integrase N-terminal SAM-like domain-containing protein [Acidobacteria bacterium]|nr:phage integrase N-terminal SAM-like domain-containing protein [Acidobacteriota bacterium]
MRAVARARHLSHRTEKAYHNFIKRFILFHNKRHPTEMGADEISQFRGRAFRLRLRIRRFSHCFSFTAMF